MARPLTQVWVWNGWSGPAAGASPEALELGEGGGVDRPACLRDTQNSVQQRLRAEPPAGGPEGFSGPLRIA
jgi:hypothetical protein